MKHEPHHLREAGEPKFQLSKGNGRGLAVFDRRQGQGAFFRQVSVFGAAGAIAIAIGGLLGYLPGLQFLGRIHPGFIPMAPSTAVAFILLGGTLLGLTLRDWSQLVLVLFGALAALAALFGALEVAGHFSGSDLSIEDALVPDAGYLGAIPISRMPPSTGAAFFIAGIATLVLVVQRAIHSPRPHLERWAGCLGGVVLATSIVFCLAYLYGSPLLYGRGATVPMALTTAFGFLMLGAATIGASGGNPRLVRLAAGSSTSSYLLRIFLPLTTLSTLLGGFAALRVDTVSGVSSVLVAAATAVLVASITGLITVWSARHVACAIDQAEEKLHRYEHIVSSTTDMLALLDKNFIYLAANAAYLQAFAKTADEMIGKTAAQVFGEEFFDKAIRSRAERCLAGEHIRYQD